MRQDWTYEQIAMLPVAQLYARDIPDLQPPEGCDLLQVLWCLFAHGDEYLPCTKLVWRSSPTITDLLTDSPQPIAVEFQDYIPQPCILHPEQVVEYPQGLHLFDEDLSKRLIEGGSTQRYGSERRGTDRHGSRWMTPTGEGPTTSTSCLWPLDGRSVAWRHSPSVMSGR
ncbi:hypothetical protein EPA93_16710 [Ktedonosporobacter rubrisoli]|uniref:Uncharacterized protein n=1 Tax=Ktedonosporobacter rubrisoli TaxID=2509675 RepID=A0A4P6JQK4_KTERU|nr:hypothetical protein [Ktedonosporobacter rubrisoli]QBD77543.1 hypothetical protein EPA93_16710 [Ktedonosporobacter rubrisoli]